MTPERWATVEKLYHAALEKGSAERGPFLAEMCTGMMPCGAKSSRCSNTTGARPSWYSSCCAHRSGHVERRFVYRAGCRPLCDLRPAGGGGIGEVYRARDRKLGRDVAIKVLPSLHRQCGTTGSVCTRSTRPRSTQPSEHRRDLRTRGGQRHQCPGSRAVEGETLSARIGRGPIPIQTALRIARQIADALDTSHEKGIVHRDLKPANIKITPASE